MGPHPWAHQSWLKDTLHDQVPHFKEAVFLDANPYIQLLLVLLVFFIINFSNFKSFP